MTLVQKYIKCGLQMMEPHNDNLLFVTITLPVCCYRKSCPKQAGIMKRFINRQIKPYSIKIYGVLEVTQKGNVHAHLIVYPQTTSVIKNIYDACKFFSVMLKTFSICDVQKLRKLDKCLAYLFKEVELTRSLIRENPIIKWELNEEREFEEVFKITKQSTDLEINTLILDF